MRSEKETMSEELEGAVAERERLENEITYCENQIRRLRNTIAELSEEWSCANAKCRELLKQHLEEVRQNAHRKDKAAL